MKINIMCRFLILFLLFCNFTVQAQEWEYIRIQPEVFGQRGDKLALRMTVDMNSLYIRSVENRIYTPILVSVKHKKEIELPKIIIKGKRRYKADQREEVLSGHLMITVPANDSHRSIYAIEKYDKNSSIPYRTLVAYKDWMSEATLNIREEVYGCCGVLLETRMHRDVFQKTGFGIQPKFRYIVPEREVEKRRYEIGKAYLDFPQGQSAIDPSFRNNRQELDKINQMIVMISSDPDVNVQSIEMRGYASPESSESYNKQLSSHRAQATRDYFVHLTTRIPASLYQVGSGGEDWEGLKNLLADYPVSHKNDILSIINTTQNLDKREQLIKNVGNGEPYRLIYRNLYPKLRRVDCQINYIARDFSIDEGKQRIIDKPKLLSQNEMYQVARTYPEGSDNFNSTIITAQRHFPQNDEANLNAAAVALSENNAALAENYLSQIKNTNSPDYANCMGVLCILKGDYNMAEMYLKRAQAEGIIEATHNLQELYKVRGRSNGI
jgi:hypothetical protein